MGLRSLTKRYSHFFIIFLLVLSQFINLGLASSTSIISNGNQAQSISPIDPEKPSINAIGVDCIDLVANDDFIVAREDDDYILDINNPSNPIEISLADSITNNIRGKIMLCKNILLFQGYNHGHYPPSIMKLELDNLSSNCSEILQFKGEPIAMNLTNEIFYLLSNNQDYVYEPEYAFSFLIYNATDLDNLSLLGNSTLPAFTIKQDEFVDLVVQDNLVFMINEENNLAIYQINSTYQLEFIKEYVFPELNEIYINGDFLFTCDNQSLKVFDYTTPSNLIYISHYNMSNLNSIRTTNNVACLISDKAFTSLDLSDIYSLTILDQYVLTDREVGELNMLELHGNFAIVLVDYYLTNLFLDNRYHGPLYIFDVSNPDKKTLSVKDSKI